jgi:hypothetical protein
MADQIDPVEERAYALGVQAGLWGRPFPEYLHTNSASFRAGATHVNYVRRFDALKTAADRYVNTPNNVTIDAYGLIDVTTGPVVISVPALVEDRWYLVQLGDMFDEIIHVIAGSKGPQPGLYFVVGPDHHGPTPATMQRITSRTKLAACAVRVFVNGEADLAGARDVLGGVHLLPFRVFQRSGLAYEVDDPDPSSLDVELTAPESLRLFDEIGVGMHRFLSMDEDDANPLVASLHHIGLSVLDGFDWKGLDESTRRGLERAAIVVDEIVDDAYAHSADIVDGWRYSTAGGRTGHDLALRGAFVKNALGALVAEEALYINCRVDHAGDPLDGHHRYELTFPPGGLPPVSVLWNVAMYDEHEFFIDNDLGRYTIGSTTDGLTPSDDGSLTLHLQHEPPDDVSRSNWLPSPAGAFNVTMRFYGGADLDPRRLVPAARHPQGRLITGELKHLRSRCLPGRRSTRCLGSGQFIRRPLLS